MSSFLDQLRACNDDAARLEPQTDPLESVALSVIPILIPPASGGNAEAKELLELIGARSNVREVILALEESLASGHPLSHTEDDGGDVVLAIDLKRILLVVQLYSICLPRLPIRKRTPSQMLEPIVSRLMDAVFTSAKDPTNHITIEFTVGTSNLCRNCVEWAAKGTASSADLASDLTKTKVRGHFQATVTTWSSQKNKKALLESFFLFIIALSSRSAHTGVVQRAFEVSFPRYVLPAHALSAGAAHDHAHHSHGHTHKSPNPNHDAKYPTAVFDTWILLKSPEAPWDSSALEVRAKFGSLVLVMEACYNPPDDDSSKDLASLTPSLSDGLVNRLILPAFTSNVDGGHALALLVREVAAGNHRSLSDPVRVNLVETLSATASMHTDPSKRHAAFRVLTNITESIVDEALKLSTILELIRDSPFSQMRAAAIGILRSHVLAGLATATATEGPQTKTTLFATPLLLEATSKTLFRLQPEAIFKKYGSGTKVTIDAEEVKRFVESEHPARLAEVMNFYYVVLARDTTNMTGIRSVKEFKQAKDQFIDPLRETLLLWQESEDPGTNDSVTDSGRAHDEHQPIPAVHGHGTG
ncbi:hypothetical protein DL93DRAFT_2153620 [Clavulina sp. PMI_390]|nr:hypothetical protein DL93DRAFT_2153620 [Clavulina sp. PMI_390]